VPATSTPLLLRHDEQPLELRPDANVVRTPAFIGLIAAVVILVLGAGTIVNRAGFSSDEEITALTVRGVAATGLPVLPSGILYLRGVLYTYSAWLAGHVLGYSLPVYRTVSLLFAILAVLLIFCVARQIGTTTTAVWAALLLASCQSHIAAASFARFYSAFVAASLLAIWLFQQATDRRRNDWAFLVALGACRLVHEFAVVLVLLPLCQAVCTPRGDPSRHRWFALCLKSAALVGVIQIGLTGLEGLSIATHLGTTNLRLGFFGSVPLAPLPLPVHRLAGPAGLLLIAAWHVLAGTVTRRITHAPWWTIVAYGVCAFLFQMGALLMVGVVAMLSQPRQAVRILLAGGMFAAASAGAWVLYTATATDAQFSLRLAYHLVSATIWYPWEGLLRLGETLTLTTLAAAVTATALVFRRAESAKDTGLRVVALFSIVTLAVLGLSSGELQWRYLLLASPPVFLLSARFIESAGEWLVRRMPLESSLLPRRAAAAIVSVALVIAFIGDQYLGVLRASDSLPPASKASMFAPPTDTRWRADVFFASVEPGDRVICNDELACLFLAGRVDDWLLPSPRIVDRYTAAGVEGRRGFYAGAKVVATGSALERIIECGGRSVALLVLDTGKFDYLESRALALQMATKFHGAVTAAGGEHLIVRISDARVTRACEGGEP
jgi:hypothetical protein